MVWDLGTQEIDVVLVDSDRLFRDALAAILDRDGLRVIAAVTSPAELAHQGSWPWTEGRRLKLLIIDVTEPSSELRETLVRVIDEVPEVKVIALSRPHHTEQLRLALDLGCCACLSKDVSLEAFEKYLRLIVSGERMLSLEFARALLREADPQGGRVVGAPGLSRRETVILRHLTMGASNKMIARHLGLSAATVKSNVKMLLRRLNISNRTEAAAWAVRSGLDLTAADGSRSSRDAWLDSTPARRCPDEDTPRAPDPHDSRNITVV